VAVQEASKSLKEIDALKKKEEEARRKEAKIRQLKSSLAQINRRLNEESVWQKIYANHLTYTQIESKIKDLDRQIAKYKKAGARRYRSKIRELENSKAQLLERLNLLKDYRQNPFKTLIRPKKITEVPTVTNPVAIVNAFSYIKQLGEHLSRFEHEIRNLELFTGMLEQKEGILKELAELRPDDAEVKKALAQTQKELKEAQDALSLHQTALVVYKKRVDEIKLRLTGQIKEQAKKAGSIGITILVLLLLVILIKWLVKRTVTDNERFYMANKIINFSFVFIVVMILLFAYIENVS
jgi:tetratricopeptide (TPR) repeat protein